MTNIVHLGDCMEGMAQYPDKWFDFAVVDPEYGLGKSVVNSGGRFKRYHNKNGNWDMKVPDDSYFDELFRISQNQIIWGGNYFGLPANKCFLIWDKQQPENISFSMAEYAWASFDEVSQVFYYRPQGQEDRFHPTQKTVALYDWIFKNYLPNGGKVIDTHIGSGSSRISAYKRGNIDFTGYELDPDYHRDQEARFREFVMKVAPADLEPITKDGQIKLF